MPFINRCSGGGGGKQSEHYAWVRDFDFPIADTFYAIAYSPRGVLHIMKGTTHYKHENGVWIQCEDNPFSVTSCNCYDDDYIYAVDASNKLLQKFSFETETWSSESISGLVNMAGLVKVDNVLYMGVSGSSSYSNKFYKIENNTFTQLGSLLYGNTYDAQLIYYKDEIFVIGGCGWQSNSSYGFVRKYDIANDTWSAVCQNPASSTTGFCGTFNGALTEDGLYTLFNQVVIASNYSVYEDYQFDGTQYTTTELHLPSSSSAKSTQCFNDNKGVVHGRVNYSIAHYKLVRPYI